MSYTREVLDKTCQGRGAPGKRLPAIDGSAGYFCPGMYGTRYFYSRREGGQPQAVHYVRDSLDGRDRVLLDPQAIDPTGLTTVAWTAPSNDGKLMAFGMYRSGTKIAFSMSWTLRQR